MKRKLGFTAAVLIILCVFMLGGCASNSANSENTLTMLLKQSDYEKEYIQRILDLYEEKTGNVVEVEAVPNTEFYDVVDEKFASGEFPDLFLHYNDSILSAYDVPDHFYYMNDQPWLDELTDDVYANSLDEDGNVLGLPFWENSLSGFYYNKTLMDKLGFAPAATQEEFNTLCAALKTTGFTPLYWAANDCNWMFQFGLDPIFADNPELLEQLNKNEITYADIPEVRDMIQWLNDAHEAGWFNGNYNDVVWEDIPVALSNGEMVVLPVWDSWFGTEMSDAKGEYTIEDFELMPVFLNTVNEGTYEGGNMNIMMVNKDSDNLELALDFLEFCATPENYNVAFDGVATINNFKNQTTNIQSKMVTDSIASVDKLRRVSTARPKIIGYTQNDVGEAVRMLFDGELDVDGAVNYMDERRIALAKELGAEGF